jgi:hypothetical protein
MDFEDIPAAAEEQEPVVAVNPLSFLPEPELDDALRSVNRQKLQPHIRLLYGVDSSIAL